MIYAIRELTFYFNVVVNAGVHLALAVRSKISLSIAFEQVLLQEVIAATGAAVPGH
jgi:hypothetical protein